MSSPSQKSLFAENHPQSKQADYITICCGRAFLSQESYHFHSTHQDDHSESIGNDVLLKTPVVKITKLPPSHPSVFQFNRNRIASIQRRNRVLYKKRYRTIRCHLCGLLIFGGNLKRHIRNAHSLTSQHKCRWCSCVYGSQKAILLHITRTHPMEQKRYGWNAAAQHKFEKSVKANKKLSNAVANEKVKKKRIDFKSAAFMADENKEENHECIFCGKIFNSKISFLHHLIVHIGDKPYKCEVCGHDFSTTNELSEHIDLWHPNDLRFKCKYCPGLFYSTQENFENHLKLRHTAAAPSESNPSESTKDFSNENEQDSENSVENDKSAYNSEIKMKVSDILKLKSIKVPNGHKCQICGKILKEIAYYRAHRLIHTDVFPYECFKCNRKFRTKANCDSHAETSHVENGEFQCNLCPCRFSSSFGLKCHSGIYHKKGDLRGKRWKILNKKDDAVSRKFIKTGIYSKKMVETVKNENGYQCKICGKTLGSPFAYNGHMLIHTNELPHQCKKCPAKFRLSSTRDRHIKTNHVENGIYKCYLCPCTFALPRGLKRHLYCYHSGTRNTGAKSKSRLKIKIPRKVNTISYDEDSNTTEYEQQDEDISSSKADITTSSFGEAVPVSKKKKPKRLKPLKRTADNDLVEVDHEDLNNIDSIQMENGLMCSLCGKILKNLICFRQHRLIHTNTFPHKCPKCNNKFRRRVDREKHLKVAHVANGNFKCSQCPCTFAAIQSLKSHNNSMHRSRLVD